MFGGAHYETHAALERCCLRGSKAMAVAHRTVATAKTTHETLYCDKV
jgi:hypothetical protein